MIRLLMIVLGAAAALVFAVGILVLWLVDPNDFRGQLETAVTAATGRSFTLEGELELEVFPALRLATGSAVLGNAEGFGPEPFARIRRAEASLALLPLLSRRIETSRIALDGLALSLARDAGGRTNWADLGSSAAPAADVAAGDAAPAGGELALDIERIAVTDASIAWTDAGTGARWLLEDVAIRAQDFALGAEFPFSIGFVLDGAEVTAEVVASAAASIDLAANRYVLAGLEVQINGSGAGWPGGAGAALVSFDALTADLGSETLALDNLELEMLGVSVNGTLSGRDLLSSLVLDGNIEIAEFAPLAVLRQLDAGIETADDAVLSRASASAAFHYDARRSALEQLVLTLDDSRLTGRIGMNGERLEFNLEVDAIDIDRYLPPSAATANPDAGSLDEVDLPVARLGDFSAAGRLAFTRAAFMGLSFTDARFDLTAGGGSLALTPAANLYGGTTSGRVGIETLGDGAARFSLRQQIDGIDLAPFARDYLDLDTLTGRGDLTLDVAATGSNLGAIREALTGAVNFAFTDGAWRGFDALYEMRRARAVLRNETAPPRPAGERATPFESVTASGRIEAGVLRNEDFRAALSFMSISGSGTANILTDDAIDFALTARMGAAEALAAAPELAEYADGELPLTVTGTLAAPVVRPDFAAIVRSRVEQRIDERVDEERERLRDRVRDSVGERLRGIFQ